ncbi:hypothetical protein VV089_18800 [Candidatus Merdisoma sp. JLR.KK011]|uniref:hypothetical protein n=1 Tax=Candidatus Merdisoma sp. JLR.KK011 TaxID=3114299 RepID=UPI002FEEDDEC
MGRVLPKYNCFYKKTEKITDCISHLLYLVLSKPSCPTFGTTINETVQAIGY